MVYCLLNMFLNVLCYCFMKDLCTYVHQGDWSVVFFPTCVSLVLVSGSHWFQGLYLEVLWRDSCVQSAEAVTFHMQDAGL